ncbi:MAG: hypothetical protein KBD55_02850 [Candidatus Pacebacteria bacterium]|jgi:hypothetical protein|nr:hypothetical protein [Candidatus Paceibacterota bacterium]
MKFFKHNLLASIVAFYIVFMPVISFAQVHIEPCETSGRICNPIKQQNFTDLLAKVLEGALKIGLPIIALAVIYSGFLFVSARGNPEELSKAKSALMYTLIGAAILMGAAAIAQLITDTVQAL